MKSQFPDTSVLHNTNIPMTLEEQLIIKLIGMVAPHLTMAMPDSKQEYLFKEINAAVYQFAEAFQKEVKEYLLKEAQEHLLQGDEPELPAWAKATGQEVLTREEEDQL